MFEYYDGTRGMVSSGILEYWRLGEVLNNNNNGYGVEVNQEINKKGFITKLIWNWESSIDNGINTSSRS